MATGDVTALYGAATATAFTLTLTSLAQAAARESTVVDNSSTKYLDALVTVQAKIVAGTPASDKVVNVYAYGGSETTTPKYPDKVTGSDAAITLDSPTNLRLLGQIQVNATGALTWKGGPWSVCLALGLPVLPPKWGIVVENRTNLAFDTSGFTTVYLGVEQNVA